MLQLSFVALFIPVRYFIIYPVAFLAKTRLTKGLDMRIVTI